MEKPRCVGLHSLYKKISSSRVNPLTTKLFNLYFHPLEVVSRWRDPQLQVSENYSDLTKWRSSVFKYCWLMSHFIFNMFKRWYIMCLYKIKTLIYAAPAVKGLSQHCDGSGNSPGWPRVRRSRSQTVCWTPRTPRWCRLRRHPWQRTHLKQTDKAAKMTIKKAMSGHILVWALPPSRALKGRRSICFSSIQVSSAILCFGPGHRWRNASRNHELIFLGQTKWFFWA